jgi:DNA-binding CsgD family transcriptional regulator
MPLPSRLNPSLSGELAGVLSLPKRCRPGGCFGDVLCQARALVFLTDLAKPPLAMPDRVAAILGLTSAEGRLVAQLVEGRELADAAERLGISVHTARSQLKSVFAKTDTHRQAELVALAGRIAKGQ